MKSQPSRACAGKSVLRAWLVLIVLACTATAQPPAPRVPGIEDLLAVKQVGATQISPDGT